MKDNKKQIEEMVREIFDTCAWRFGKPNDYKEIFNDIAEDLIKLNYLKIDEDRVVLSKDEKQKLLKEMYEQGKFDALADLEKDGKVLMSGEEYKTWFKKDGYFLGYRDGENSAVNYYETLALPSKEMETAEKFYNTVVYKILELNFETDNKDYDEGFFDACKEILQRIDHVAKQYGVDVEK